jgi:hypothetical protein
MQEPPGVLAAYPNRQQKMWDLIKDEQRGYFGNGLHRPREMPERNFSVRFLLFFHRVSKLFETA